MFKTSTFRSLSNTNGSKSSEKNRIVDSSRIFKFGQFVATAMSVSFEKLPERVNFLRFLFSDCAMPSVIPLFEAFWHVFISKDCSIRD